MRLLRTDKISLVQVADNDDIPPYAILSHTWDDGEILFQDLDLPALSDCRWPYSRSTRDEKEEEEIINPEQLDRLKARPGFHKLQKSVQLAHRNGYEYIWIDTCCIDKSSSAELSEAINSMYRWYEKAAVCYAYLSDVEPAGAEDLHGDASSFRRCRWFTRGWTLQELIAATDVQFFARDWSYLGDKKESNTFLELLSNMTGVQASILTGETCLEDMSIATRMRWAAGRRTTRTEDMAYSLLGIFDVNMPLLYGEGKKAFIRLQEAILLKDDDQSLFAWHAAQPKNQSSYPRTSELYSGLLADSPDRFASDETLATVVSLYPSENASAITSKGLRVEFCVLPCRDVDGADLQVVLSCETESEGPRRVPVIYLKRLLGLGNQYARIHPYLRTYRDRHLSSQSDASFTTVFVKQDPSTDLRLITIRPSPDSWQGLEIPNKAGVKRVSWKVADVYPRQGWVVPRKTFQTTDLNLGLPLCIFRLGYFNNATQGPTTEERNRSFVDVAVGLQLHNQRVVKSWCKILGFHENDRPAPTLAQVHEQAKLMIQNGQVDFAQWAMLLAQDKTVPVWAAVSERNRKGGFLISLFLGSDRFKPLDTAVKPVVQPSNGYEHSTEKEAVSPEDSALLGTDASLDLQPMGQEEYQRLFWQQDVTTLMEEIAIDDSVELSFFQQTMGNQVRIRPGRSAANRHTMLADLREYCMTTVLSSAESSTRLMADALGRGNIEDAHIYFQTAKDDTNSLTDPTVQFRAAHWLVLGNDVYVLDYAISCGVTPFTTSLHRLTPLHLATLQDTQEIMSRLLSRLPDMPTDGKILLAPTMYFQDTMLHFAASYITDPAFWSKENALLERFNPLSVTTWCTGLPNALGETPLHRACAMGNEAALQYMLTYNPEGLFDQVDNLGRTPLWHAACNNEIGIMRALSTRTDVQHGLADDRGLAPIHVAARQGSYDCLEYLLQYSAGGGGGGTMTTTGSSSNSANLPAGSLGLLPTHFAAALGHSDCLKLLLAYGGGIVADHGEGLSFNALHFAIANGHKHCAELLWELLGPEAASFLGWSACVKMTGAAAEDDMATAGAVPAQLKWLYLMVDEGNWVALEDPTTQSIMDCIEIEPDGSMPKLWAVPSGGRNHDRIHRWQDGIPLGSEPNVVGVDGEGGVMVMARDGGAGIVGQAGGRMVTKPLRGLKRLFVRQGYRSQVDLREKTSPWTA